MGYIDIRKLSLDELLGVVNLYPWFGGARKELCERMHRMGGDAWGESQYADAAMDIPSRTDWSIWSGLPADRIGQTLMWKPF